MLAAIAELRDQLAEHEIGGAEVLPAEQRLLRLARLWPAEEDGGRG
jgi:hypothetical protein